MSVHSRLASESIEADLDVHCSSSSEAEPEKVVLRSESPPLASVFALSTSCEEDVLDLKWRQSPRALICPTTPVLSPRFDYFGWFAFKLLFVELGFVLFKSLIFGLPIFQKRWVQWELEDVSVRVCFVSCPSATVCLGVCVALQQITQRGNEIA